MPRLDPNSDLARRRLTDLRHGLLRLHKALLDSERVSYERAHGRIESRGEFFQLVIGNAWFAWLHAVSELVVQIDEMLDAEEPATAIDAPRLIDRALLLLKPSKDGDAFATPYFDSPQHNPALPLPHP